MKLAQEKKSKVSLEELPKSEVLAKELKKVRYREQYLKTLKSTVFTLLSVAAVAVLIATIWLPVLQIYGKSMTPTLKSGDLVVSVNDKAFKQGDVIAFYYNNKVLVKRVIATSGQWVDIDDKGNVSVDGYLIDEPYLKEEDKAYGETNIELPYQVPDGKIFVMGDQRSVSIDSRNTAVGTVGDEQIVGRLTLRIWPLNRINWIK
ncbi:signal peptidase I [Streptococcus henryi]|uniref:signal peptidase I n=1 Tax=Streptococcus henryi TaxID=439219 RepID=UPI00036B8F1D|nr:signal peptidase I [Streptococcus henryi]